MGSSYFRDPNMESERKTSDGIGGGGGRGSRRGKKTGHDKPKQPQRGLGVAQLEKIRLHGQLGVTNFYHPSLVNPYAPSTFDQDDIRAHSAAPFPSSPFSYNSPSSSSSAASHGYNPHFLMGTDLESGGSIGYDDAVPVSYCPSWIHGRKPSNGAEFPRHIMRPMTPTRNLLNFSLEADSRQKNNKDDSGGSEDQELDLELRLSR
ncbi:hypothetical protein MLD38_014341 [Melastoma candidum]|uniref:Uncharacterized protein n=1 Tax=Melastoma candidum TaxID=119954 RepID=A0ACB9RFK3_9MYRT|nr:hypothetical protein MLD38_014341 [Melastoma candidum]